MLVTERVRQEEQKRRVAEARANNQVQWGGRGREGGARVKGGGRVVVSCEPLPFPQPPISQTSAAAAGSSRRYRNISQREENKGSSTLLEPLVLCNKGRGEGDSGGPAGYCPNLGRSGQQCRTRPVGAASALSIRQPLRQPCPSPEHSSKVWL